ncbi:family of serine hydrolases 1 [Diplogelasinospora grovesii]|uniref:Family of serine hydrolases 1 n=1 Tax=Diplogelasinospora grovesii TaxID=303347 RepID=A0AAN6NHB6_9PEZI|nr:family of serine hydrolases 1 [Diplogelasinospora grovesii]
MRVLGLHGAGTSAYIFKSQTVAFRSKLPPSWSFDFIDAPFPAASAPGVNVLFDSAHYSWFARPTVNAIRGAHQHLLDYLSENGPYDLVICFSQGCALIASFLLYHAREAPDEPLPFKAAVFICGGLPLPVLDDLGVDVSARAREINEQTVTLLKSRAGALTELAQNPDRIEKGVGLWDNTDGLVHDPDTLPDPRTEDVFGLDYTRMPGDLRIKIPTVHIYGAKDPRWPASIQLAYFCEETRRKMYDHQGGHDIPRSTGVSLKIAGLMEELGRMITS